MWIFTRYGYFEAVIPVPTAALKDPTVHLWSRRRSHLRNLQQAEPALAALPVQGNREEGWYLAVPRSFWADVVCRLVLEMDYTDFRAAVREAGHCDLAYYTKLNEVAHTLGELQGA